LAKLVCNHAWASRFENENEYLFIISTGKTTDKVLPISSGYDIGEEKQSVNWINEFYWCYFSWYYIIIEFNKWKWQMFNLKTWEQIKIKWIFINNDFTTTKFYMY
jgi:hypothetical protein